MTAPESVVWDGKSAIYSKALGRYYANPSEAEGDLVAGQTLADLKLVICEPVYVRQIVIDYFVDDLPEEGVLPDEVYDAIDEFNNVVADIVLSWRPVETSLQLENSQ